VFVSDKIYQSTDGVGTLSKEFESQNLGPIKQMKRRLPLKEVVLFMGSKGMISVDDTLRGPVVCLCPSTVQFIMPEAVQDIEISRTPLTNLVRTS
jgi:hypothetical protein